MLPRPFSIRIFLPDGLRVIEKSNWTGIGIVVPRNLFSTAKQRDEFSRTGVYVLAGQDDESEMPVIYIGQGDPVRAKFEAHISDQSTRYLAFVSFPPSSVEVLEHYP